MRQLRDEAAMRGRELSAEDEFKATLFETVREQQLLRKLGVPPEAGLSSYLVPGARVAISAIYDKFHEPGCTSESTRGALWAGDVFPICGCAGVECETRFAVTFESAQASWEKHWIRT